MIPLSLFASVYANTPAGEYRLTWTVLANVLKAESLVGKASKTDSMLFCPTLFGGRPRAKANATKAGILVLDVEHDASLDDALARLRAVELRSICYSTARSRPGDERYRIVIPLVTPVEPSEWTALWHSLTGVLELWADTTKNYSASMFYLPGAYAGAWNRFEMTDGEPLEATEWLRIFPIAVTAPPSPPDTNWHWPERAVGGSNPTEAIRGVLPANKRAASGWIKFDCPACGDRRQRGGLLVTPSGGFRFRCFNAGCEFERAPTGWEPGNRFAGRPRRLFELLGGDVTEINFEYMIRRLNPHGSTVSTVRETANDRVNETQ